MKSDFLLSTYHEKFYTFEAQFLNVILQCSSQWELGISFYEIFTAASRCRLVPLWHILKYLKKMSYYHFPNKFRKKWTKWLSVITYWSAKSQNMRFRDMGLGLFLPLTFWQDILAQTFHHGDFLARGYFGTRTFRHGYFSATWTFWHGVKGGAKTIVNTYKLDHPGGML